MAGRHDQNYIMRWLRDLLCGFLIGAGAILPGVSGGVLAVVFDIYRPFMEVLTHPGPPCQSIGNGFRPLLWAGARAFWVSQRVSPPR